MVSTDSGTVDGGATVDASVSLDSGVTVDGGNEEWDWRDAGRPPSGTANDFLTRTFTATNGLVLPYRLYVPPSYDANRRYPLILFLHGAGERGSDNRAQVGNALRLAGPSVQHVRPAFVVAPQAPSNSQWVDTPWSQGSYMLASVPPSRPMVATLELITLLGQQYNLDPTRLLITGLSMGGFGTWDAIMRNPRQFAAALPICGGADPTRAPDLAPLPITTTHGTADAVVPIRGTREMVQALRAAGGKPTFIEYQGVGHDVWSMTYADAAIMRWFISQHR
jgi:predicted peptidase